MEVIEVLTWVFFQKVVDYFYSYVILFSRGEYLVCHGRVFFIDKIIIRINIQYFFYRHFSLFIIQATASPFFKSPINDLRINILRNQFPLPLCLVNYTTRSIGSSLFIPLDISI